MAILRFSFGTMGSGKSTLALQIHHNLRERGLQGILCSQLDRADGRVSSALGVSADAVEVGPRLDLFEMALAVASRRGRIDYLVCDEAQFYLPSQIDQLARMTERCSWWTIPRTTSSPTNSGAAGTGRRATPVSGARPERFWTQMPSPPMRWLERSPVRSIR